MPKLKVFRTSIGFHDAYVAAPSRAAALKAWGANTDLFAAGSAEVVEGEALTAEPLREPGKVIKKSRGTAADHLNALSDVTAQRNAKRSSANEKKRPVKMKPRPPRAALDKAEAALEAADRDHRSAMTALDAKIEVLREEQEKLVAKHRESRRHLEQQSEAARRTYDVALEKWRKSPN